MKKVVHWDISSCNIVMNLPCYEGLSTNPTVVDSELFHYEDPVNGIRMWVAESIVMEAKHRHIVCCHHL